MVASHIDIYFNKSVIVILYNATVLYSFILHVLKFMAVPIVAVLEVPPNHSNGCKFCVDIVCHNDFYLTQEPEKCI